MRADAAVAPYGTYITSLIGRTTLIHAACEQRPLYDKLPHDSVRDISPVSLFVTVPSVVVVSPEVLSVRDAQEFVRSSRRIRAKSIVRQKIVDNIVGD